MPKYLVGIYYSASIAYELEATDEESALEMAKAIEEPRDTFMEKITDSIEFEDANILEVLPGG